MRTKPQLKQLNHTEQKSRCAPGRIGRARYFGAWIVIFSLKLQVDALGEIIDVPLR